MSETPNDPAGTTHQFQNFQAQRPAEKTSKVNTGLIVGIVAAVAVVVVLAVIVAMML
ncbi:hypothetical protein [Actinomadura sp. 21ATH]|uniref:hypothetical protein n=1 Tax=Actinomadura sp. 21ATH TaxID=1735444 RepID=UPI0035BFE99D